MFKSFTHGERTVNVIISKGEDCGVIKESVDKLRNIVNNNAKTVAMAMLITAAVFYFCGKRFDDLDERVSKLESKQTAEENQEN